MSQTALEPLRGRLSPTALYTAGCWVWAGLPGAELLEHRGTRRVFRGVNGALALARLFAPRAPSLRHGLVQRHVMIDGLMRDHGPGTVLELAAGLSARGLRATDDPAVSYVEVDRPEVVARKRALLERSDAGKAALARPNLRFVPGDIADLDLAGLVPAAPEPLLVIVEGLLMYLDEAAQARLFQRLAALLAGRARARLVFDLVPTGEQPPPGLAARALAAIWKRATRGGEFVRDGRKREDVLAMLEASGFQAVECLSPADAPARWKVPHLDRRTQQLVFVAGAQSSSRFSVSSLPESRGSTP